MKILLANPKGSSIFHSFSFIFPPIGLLYVAAYAEKMGHDVTVEDFSISKKHPSKVPYNDYPFVGITTDTRRFPEAIDIAREAKKAGAAVVMGGVHPSFVDRELLEGGDVDFVVHGEGEITFHELAETLENGNDVSNVHGISYLSDGCLRRTPRRAPIPDLNALPLPARHLVDIEAYKRRGFKYGNKRSVAIISTSRGCPFDCSFCAVPAISGKTWRYRSVDSIIEEIDHIYHKLDYRAVAFTDDNFTIQPKRVIALCERIIEKKYDLWWWSMSSPHTVIKNEKMIEMMAKAGAKSIFIGVESAHTVILKDYKKKMDENTAQKAVKVMKKYGIEVYASYIIGSTQDNVRSILETIKFARKLDTSVGQFSILTPYPGTALYEQIKDKIVEKRWRLYDGFHLVFKHGKIPVLLMQLLLVWAYVSFYTRSWHVIRGFMRVFSKNNLIAKKISGEVT